MPESRDMKFKEILQEGKLLANEAQKFVIKNKSKGPKLDSKIHQAHQKAFQKIDCLQCANCCKTTSPIFRDVDIKRIAKALKIKEKMFVDTYLNFDTDGDFVLKTAPCPFLDLATNKCGIYEFRPAACREYPHTDRKNSIQIGALHLKNLDICPAVVEVFKQIIQK